VTEFPVKRSYRVPQEELRMGPSLVSGKNVTVNGPQPATPEVSNSAIAVEPTN
jgi:hypothetical protein